MVLFNLYHLHVGSRLKFHLNPSKSHYTVSCLNSQAECPYTPMLPVFSACSVVCLCARVCVCVCARARVVRACAHAVCARACVVCACAKDQGLMNSIA